MDGKPKLLAVDSSEGKLGLWDRISWSTKVECVYEIIERKALDGRFDALVLRLVHDITSAQVSEIVRLCLNRNPACVIYASTEVDCGDARESVDVWFNPKAEEQTFLPMLLALPRLGIEKSANTLDAAITGASYRDKTELLLRITRAWYLTDIQKEDKARDLIHRLHEEAVDLNNTRRAHELQQLYREYGGNVRVLKESVHTEAKPHALGEQEDASFGRVYGGRRAQ